MMIIMMMLMMVVIISTVISKVKSLHMKQLLHILQYSF